MVRDLRRDRAICVADGEQRRREPARRVVEGVRAQRRVEIERAVRREAPRHRSAVGKARVADGPLLEVPAIAPVGIEEAETAMLERGSGCVCAVLDGVGETPADAQPRGRARRNPERQAGLREAREPFAERILGVVAPFADGDTVGHLRDERRIAREHVAPDDHLVTVELGEGAQRRDPREVLVETLARQLPRLVEADVDPPARERRQQLAEQLAHEGE